MAKKEADKVITVADINLLADNQQLITKQFIITKRGLRFIVNRLKDSHIHAFTDALTALSFAKGYVADVAETSVVIQPTQIVKVPGLEKAKSVKKANDDAKLNKHVLRHIFAFAIYCLFMLCFLAFGWFYFIAKEYIAELIELGSDLPVVGGFIIYGMISLLGIIMAVLAMNAGKKLHASASKIVLLSLNGASFITALCLYIFVAPKSDATISEWFANIVANLDVVIYFSLFAISEVVMFLAKRKQK